jgi:hypothetical protein
MNSKSCKAKSRVLQNEVRDELRKLAAELGFGLEDDDIVGREMGQRGSDVRMSPAAMRAFGALHIECKNVEKMNVVGAFNDHLSTYEGKDGLKFLVHTRNAVPGKKKQPRVVILTLEDFMSLLKDRLLLNTQEV